MDFFGPSTIDSTLRIVTQKLIHERFIVPAFISELLAPKVVSRGRYSSGQLTQSLNRLVPFSVDLLCLLSLNLRFNAVLLPAATQFFFKLWH